MIKLRRLSSKSGKNLKNLLISIKINNFISEMMEVHFLETHSKFQQSLRKEGMIKRRNESKILSFNKLLSFSKNRKLVIKTS